MTTTTIRQWFDRETNSYVMEAEQEKAGRAYRVRRSFTVWEVKHSRLPNFWDLNRASLLASLDQLLESRG